MHVNSMFSCHVSIAFTLCMLHINGNICVCLCFYDKCFHYVNKISNCAIFLLLQYIGSLFLYFSPLNIDSNFLFKKKSQGELDA